MSMETLRAFLGWGAVLNLVWLTVLFCLFTLGKDWIYRIHSRWFSIPKETMETVVYAIMGWYKLATFLLFVIPYAVLRFCL